MGISQSHQEGSPCTWPQLKCVLIRPFSFTSPVAFQLQPSAQAGRKMALRYPFVTLIGARRAVLTFGPVGSCSSLVSISSKKSSLINLSSSKMCDPLRAKPLKWKDGAGLEAQVRRGLSGGVPGKSARRHNSLLTPMLLLLLSKPFPRECSRWASPWERFPFAVFAKRE